MGLSNASEYVEPERVHEEYRNAPGWEYEDPQTDCITLPRRTRWSTQTTNQAVGTGVLVGSPWWVHWSACWACETLGGPSGLRAVQSACIGRGAQ
jgi:hypothetical protein